MTQLYVNIIRDRSKPIYTASEDGRIFTDREKAVQDIMDSCLSYEDGQIGDGHFVYECTLAVDVTDAKAAPLRLNLFWQAHDALVEEMENTASNADHRRTESRSDVFV